MFYELGSVSKAVAGFVQRAAVGEEFGWAKLLSLPLYTFYFLALVPAVIVGGTVGAIVGLLMSRHRSEACLTGMIAGNELAYFACVGLSYVLASGAFVAALPVSVLASPVVAAVKNRRR